MPAALLGLWPSPSNHHLPILGSKAGEGMKKICIYGDFPEAASPHLHLGNIGHKFVTWDTKLQGSLGDVVFLPGSHVPKGISY